MAAICCYVPPSPTLHCRRVVHGFRCCSVAPNNHKKKERPSPQLLKFAVSGVTELLRLLSSPNHRSDAVSYEQRDDISVSAVDDVLMILKSDYENAYFVTGIFTSAIYTEDCIFEDPTIIFRGKDLYSRNLNLLVPFFDCPSIVLQKIEKVHADGIKLLSIWIHKIITLCLNLTIPLYDYLCKNTYKGLRYLSFKESSCGTGRSEEFVEGIDSETNFVYTKWKLRTYLKLPWRPLISVDGSTVYDLDDKFKIVRHAESWDISALEAIAQIFTPSFGKPGD